MVFVNTITLLMLGMIIYISPIASFFEVQPLNLAQITLCFVVV
jgi:Ca2+-transporting ATPase